MKGCDSSESLLAALIMCIILLMLEACLKINQNPEGKHVRSEIETITFYFSGSVLAYVAGGMCIIE